RRDAVTGRRHDEISPDGNLVLDEVQRRALAGEDVDDIDDSTSDPSSVGRTVSARPERDGDGAITGVLVAIRDLRSSEGDTPLMARDPLTGLAGRQAFAHRLREVLSNRPKERSVVVFAVNIDGFRSINNLHGARVGDRVLRIIAERLVSGTRSRLAGTGSQEPAEGPALGRRRRDTVARLSADEFGIICGTPAPGPAETKRLADRLLRIAQTPITIGDAAIRMTASVGFIVIGREHDSEDDVLRDLDIALQEAKSRGPN